MKKTILVLAVLLFAASAAQAQDAHQLVEDMLDYMRGETSYSVSTMTIHRPDWEREMTVKAWTKGTDLSLFRITDPPKDKGNGTLKKGRQMWTYNPKVNRVIKVPPSMMSQAWMGSDFSNNDLAKTDSVIYDYTHSIIGEETHEGKKVYVIESTPKPSATVIWGMERIKIREDMVLLAQEFYDEDKEPVKILTTSDIQKLDDRLQPKVWKMQKADTPDEYTVFVYDELDFGRDIPDSSFTLQNLRTPGR